MVDAEGTQWMKVLVISDESSAIAISHFGREARVEMSWKKLARKKTKPKPNKKKKREKKTKQTKQTCTKLKTTDL